MGPVEQTDTLHKMRNISVTSQVEHVLETFEDKTTLDVMNARVVFHFEKQLADSVFVPANNSGTSPPKKSNR